MRLRLKALFRARAIRTPGKAVYERHGRARWIAKLPERGARLRARGLYAELDVISALPKKAKVAMVGEAMKDPAWPVLEAIPYLGPVRIAVLLATLGTPWRFRAKRNLWAYAGLAVVTHSSADHELVHGTVRRRQRRPLTRGLNRNRNRRVKGVFKGAANAATGKPGPLREYYDGLLAKGMREERARVTLARKLAALTLRLWKPGEIFDAEELMVSQPAPRSRQNRSARMDTTATADAVASRHRRASFRSAVRRC